MTENKDTTLLQKRIELTVAHGLTYDGVQPATRRDKGYIKTESCLGQSKRYGFDFYKRFKKHLFAMEDKHSYATYNAFLKEHGWERVGTAHVDKKGSIHYHNPEHEGNKNVRVALILGRGEKPLFKQFGIYTDTANLAEHVIKDFNKVAQADITYANEIAECEKHNENVIAKREQILEQTIAEEKKKPFFDQEDTWNYEQLLYAIHWRENPKDLTFFDDTSL